MEIRESGLAEAGTAEAAIAAVICAAGSSSRMGGLKKEYCPLPNSKSLTVLGSAVSAFAAVPAIETIVIAVPADSASGEAAARKALPPELLADSARPRIVFVSGGNTRRASVHNALSLLAAYKPEHCARPDYVLIHDGARPWISPSLIEQIIAAVKKYRAVIPLLPLTETPKETDAPLAATDAVDSNAAAIYIKQHLKRATTGTAQTPQAFAFPEILQAHEQSAEYERSENIEYTDDAEVWASFIGPVAVIPGSPENRKITVPGDL
ncbi:MAG: 2-C-methyl-D-erythritol 4-phosphate cytidylyltransferase [Treponema sp.]|jgi:2-C-methyl-D-erythritol 4-phosphate cytidylyltransferase|nr:2-C-methyl-D-erythritol 4-phosphate cytidylyltransferase [Treponema sp.]